MVYSNRLIVDCLGEVSETVWRRRTEFVWVVLVRKVVFTVDCLSMETQMVGIGMPSGVFLAGNVQSSRKVATSTILVL